MALPEPIITEADVHAVRAVIAGRATGDEQKRAMRWIAEQCCHIFDSPYIARGLDRESFVMMGRHQVGTMISAMNTPATLEAAQNHDASLKAGETAQHRRGTRRP